MAIPTVYYTNCQSRYSVHVSCTRQSPLHREVKLRCREALNHSERDWQGQAKNTSILLPASKPSYRNSLSPGHPHPECHVPRLGAAGPSYHARGHFPCVLESGLT